MAIVGDFSNRATIVGLDADKLKALQDGGGSSVTWDDITGKPAIIAAGATTAAAQTALGMTTIGRGVAISPDFTTAQTVIGITAPMQTVVQSTNVANARVALGGEATGVAVFTSATAADAQTAIGVSTTIQPFLGATSTTDALEKLGCPDFGVSVATTSTADELLTDLGATTVGKAVFLATDAAAACTAVAAIPVSATPTNSVRAGVLQATAIPDVSDPPTKAEIDGILAALRFAGVIANS